VFNFARKKLFLPLIFITCSPTLNAAKEYNTSQQAQALFATLKLGATIVALEQEYTIPDRLQALLARSLATISHGSNKVLERSNTSDIFSKVAHGNAALWQMVKRAC